MVIYRTKDKKSCALDFRETAPEASRKELYMKDGKAVPSLSLTGALAVAVPGEVAGLIAGAQTIWQLADAGADGAGHQARERRISAWTRRLRFAIDRQQSGMKKFADLGRIYMPNGEVPAEGELIRQPDLADTLKAIAQQGADVFYQGWIAAAIVETIKKKAVF